MPDYLEEQLSHADALLEQIRKMERSASGLPQENSEHEKNVEITGDRTGKDRETTAENKNVSEFVEEVDNLEGEVDNLKKQVDDSEIVSEKLREEAEKEVNQKVKQVDEPQTGSQKDSARSKGREEEADPEERRSNEEKARKNSPPLAVQLEELDRALSAVAAMIPEGRDVETGWKGAPVSRSVLRSSAVYPGVTGTPDGDWNGAGTSDWRSAGSGAELAWVEQADRVFRRDSRRYDGGFYLY